MAVHIWMLPIAAIAPSPAYTSNEFYLIQSLTYQSAAAQAALKRSYNAQLAAQKRRIDTLEARLKTAQVGTVASRRYDAIIPSEVDSLRAQLATQKAAFNDALAAKDTEFARERAALQAAGNDLLRTSDGSRALQVYLSGESDSAETAIAILERATQFRSANDLRTIATLAVDAQRRGGISAERALVLCEKIPEEFRIGSDWDNLSSLALAVGNADRAIQYATNYYSKTNDELSKSSALSYLTDAYLLLGEFERSLSFAKEASEISTKALQSNPELIENHRNFISRKCELASVHFYNGEVDQAVNVFKQSIKLSESFLLRDSNDLALLSNHSKCLIGLARAELSKGQYSEAVKNLKESISIYEYLTGIEKSWISYRITLIQTLSFYSLAEYSAGNSDISLTAIQRAENLVNSHSFSESSSIDLKLAANQVLGSKAAILTQLNRRREAYDVAVRSLSIANDILRSNENIAQFQKIFLLSLITIANTGIDPFGWRKAAARLDLIEAKGIKIPGIEDTLTKVRSLAANEGARQ